MKTEMDPLVEASNVYKLLYENDRVRVLEGVFKPDDVAKMHNHPDRVIYVISGGKMRVTFGGKNVDNEIKAGSVTFNLAQDHEAKNIGSTTIDFIMVELKK